MFYQGKHVAIIGAGVAGLTAADDLAGFGVDVSLFEKAAFLGGHAIQLSCKAAPDCVKCGACMATDKLQRASSHETVAVHTGAQIDAILPGPPIQVEYSLLTDGKRADRLAVDAVLLTTGFLPYDPTPKPYGYGRFQNVMTSLDAERRLRQDGVLRRPSDGKPAERIAFIQCVGSRDTTLGHSWCSKICCGSSLRMARLIQSRQASARATCFYIDVQTFGKDFAVQYPLLQDEIEMIRAIPGDILSADDGDLNVAYFHPDKREAAEARFDAVILSIGLTPSPDTALLAGMLCWPQDQSGFLMQHASGTASSARGVFTAGTVLGPMSIAESIGSAEQAVWDIIHFLDGGDTVGSKPKR